MQKTKYLIVLGIVAFLIMGAVIFLIFRYEPKEIEIRLIDRLYVSHSGLGWTTEEYKIDFVEKTFNEYHTGIFDDYVERDCDMENEGFIYTANLSDEAISEFMKMSSLHGLHNWDTEYPNSYIMDGHQWSITIYYHDGTVKNIYGSNAYPVTWEQIAEDLKTLTGANVF